MERKKMTIEKYLQNKVDINEISESDKDFMLKEISKIEDKDNFLYTDKEKYYIYRILFIYYIDYINASNIKRTNMKIYNNIADGISKDDIVELDNILDILVAKNVLKLEKGEYLEFYYLSEAVINSLKATIENKNIEVIKANNIFMIYNNYHNEAINQIEATLKSVFGFEITSDNGQLNFDMGGCGYNVYLSRGYICLEEEDNSSIENIYNVESVEEFIDLIKDLKENA